MRGIGGTENAACGSYSRPESPPRTSPLAQPRFPVPNHREFATTPPNSLGKFEARPCQGRPISGDFPASSLQIRESPPRDGFASDSPHLLGVRLGFVGSNRLVIALPRFADVQKNQDQDDWPNLLFDSCTNAGHGEPTPQRAASILPRTPITRVDPSLASVQLTSSRPAWRSVMTG